MINLFSINLLTSFFPVLPFSEQKKEITVIWYGHVLNKTSLTESLISTMKKLNIQNYPAMKATTTYKHNLFCCLTFRIAKAQINSLRKLRGYIQDP